MTELLPVPVAPADLSLSLDRAKAYAGAARSTRTMKAYASAFALFVTWCREAGANSMPADPLTVAAYVAHLADTGRKPATIDLHVAAIGAVHRAGGFDNPTGSEAVKATLRGARRALGTRQTRKAPATAETVRKMLKKIPAGPAGLRDRAVILIGLATVISYETGGTFDPSIRGGAGRRHIGLIQFGPNEQQTYGASQGQSFEEQLPAVEGYLTDRGFKPGMSRLDLYSTINAGRPGLYNASDAGNGGAPGTVADKVANQMGPHEAKAAAFLGGTFSPGAATPVGAFGLSGPVAAGTPASVTPAGGAAMQAPQQTEGGPSVAALLRALGGDGQTATQAEPAQSAGPAPLALQPMQRRAQPFDAARYLASPARSARA